MDGTGQMMQDAGDWLADAGAAMRDGGMAGQGGDDPGGGLMDAMMEMGGQMLSDAGNMLSDAGEVLHDASGGDPDGGGRDALVDGASAQAACGSCTAGQRQMIVTADQDLAQLRGGTVERTGWTVNRGTPFDSANCSVDITNTIQTAVLADGPLVLTDAYVAGDQAVLFTVPRGQPCYEEATGSGSNVLSLMMCDGMNVTAVTPRLQQPAASRSLFSAPTGFALTGGRIVIDAGETLCAIAQPQVQQLMLATASPVIVSRLLWSGFEPYE